MKKAKNPSLIPSYDDVSPLIFNIMSEPTLIRGAAAMVTLNGVDEVVIFAATPEKLTQALNGITGEIVHCTVMPGPLFPVANPDGPTPEGFAAKFNGREMGGEIHPTEELALKAAGMVAVFGYSDDCTEFRGAINDEVGTGELRITAKGKILEEDAFDALESLVADGTIDKPVLGLIEANFADHHTYETKIPHATFVITEDSAIFCRGIVFRLADIGKGVAK